MCIRDRGIDDDARAVDFATWVDPNPNIIHTRLFFVDGTSTLHEWNGAIGVVKSVASRVITLEDGKTAEQLGFDDGSTTNQTVIINGDEYLYSNDPTGQTLSLTTDPSGVAAGDLVIATPTTSEPFSNLNIDHVYNWNNQLPNTPLSLIHI